MAKKINCKLMNLLWNKFSFLTVLFIHSILHLSMIFGDISIVNITNMITKSIKCVM